MNATRRAAITVLETALAPTGEIVVVEPHDAAVPDDEVLRRYDMALEARAEALAVIDAQIDRWRGQILQRLRERGARAIPHADYECERIDKYTAWEWDIPTLQDAAPLLNETERAKILKWIAERQIIEPAHWEAGNARSIQALIDKYAGSPVAAILEKARRRTFLREDLRFARRSS